jgi:hypothetical protein
MLDCHHDWVSGELGIVLGLVRQTAEGWVVHEQVDYCTHPVSV